VVETAGESAQPLDFATESCERVSTVEYVLVRGVAAAGGYTGGYSLTVVWSQEIDAQEIQRLPRGTQRSIGARHQRAEPDGAACCRLPANCGGVSIDCDD